MLSGTEPTNLRRYAELCIGGQSIQTCTNSPVGSGDFWKGPRRRLNAEGPA